MSLAFTDWVIEEQEREERLDLKEHRKIYLKVEVGKYLKMQFVLTVVILQWILITIEIGVQAQASI